MISITEVARFRQQVIKYSLKNGVTKASIRYRVSRNSIYRWRKRYDGTWQSLKDRSHRPKSHPKQHTKQEHDLIMRYYHRNKDDKIVLWMKIREKGYKRSYAVMCQYIRRQGIEEIDKKKYRKNKPYMRAEYPGQKVQVERQHGIDEKRFYRKMQMYGLADGRKQLKKYNTISNKIPKTCLNFCSPNEKLERYLGVM